MSFLEGLVFCLLIQGASMLAPGQNHFLLLSLCSSGAGAFSRMMAVFGIASAGAVFCASATLSIWLGGKAASGIWFSLLNALGIAYLLYLGIGMIASFRVSGPEAKPSASPGGRKGASAPPLSCFLSGFLVNISNAKSALFFGGIVSAAMPIAEMRLSGFALATGAFFANSILFHGLVASVLALPRIQGFASARERAIRLAVGIAFIGFAATSAALVLRNSS